MRLIWRSDNDEVRRRISATPQQKRIFYGRKLQQSFANPVEKKALLSTAQFAMRL